MNGPAAGSAAPPRAPAPERTLALVVGVERYAAGPAWDLPGPARDAVRFRERLLGAGVPEHNVLLCLAPLAPLTPPADLGAPHLPADHATLRDIVVTRLAARAAATPVEALWVWWGGHGVLDQDERLRLFCADATVADKRNLDLESMRRTLASDALPGTTRQTWIVDACQTFEEQLGFRRTLPSETLPTGRRVQGHHQTLLLAATRGERAVNDPARGTGLFSDSVIEALTASPAPWPDPERLFQDARARLERLGAGHRTAQLPVLSFHGPQRAEHPPPATGGGGPGRDPTERLVEALLAYPMMADPEERQTLVMLLGGMGTRIRRHNRARADLVAIVLALRERPEELRRLYEAVTVLDDDAERGAVLATAVQECIARRAS